METIVTLRDCQYIETMSLCMRLLNVQCADEEHECDAQALAPRHLQPKDFVERQGQHPYIKDNAYARVRPDQCIDADAASFRYAVELVPIVADGLTREDGNDGEDDAEESVESYRALDKYPRHAPCKDPQEEEQKGHFHEDDLYKVQNLERVNRPYESHDVVKRDCPYISSESVW